jgi:hypothetical protein
MNVICKDCGQPINDHQCPATSAVGSSDLLDGFWGVWLLEATPPSLLAVFWLERHAIEWAGQTDLYAGRDIVFLKWPQSPSNGEVSDGV